MDKNPKPVNVINWDRIMLDHMKVAYKLAVNNKLNEFVFDGNVYDTGYAKYLIEYLNGKFYGAGAS